MAHLIGNNLAVCFVRDRAVALDLRRDRYLGLGRLQAAIVKDALVSADTDALGRRLVEAGLTPTPVLGIVVPVHWSPPVRSAFEEQSERSSFSIVTALEVAWLVSWTWFTLKVSPFSWVIERHRVSRRKSRRAALVSPDHAIGFAQRFAAVRGLTPIEPVCLLDSLALTKFLARRGVDADLVLAVDLDPFEAHAWVQQGDRVLNESAHRAAMLTPILVV